jgi:hypothetical protein
LASQKTISRYCLFSMTSPPPSLSFVRADQTNLTTRSATGPLNLRQAGIKAASEEELKTL